MSTYLVAFVVSDFSFVEHGPFRILGRPHAIDYARYPLSVSPLILSAIANLTEVEYTLPKMDQVAVPNFPPVAMENWGLVIYRAYDAAEPDDLFQAWQEAASADGVLPSGLSVKEILDTWTLQAGYPVLTVTRDYDAGTATVTQKNFMAIGSAGDQRWYVPISYTTRRERNFNRTAPSVWLSPEEGSSVTLEGIAADDWLVLNIQDAAYYRVNYDEKNWQLLSTALNELENDGIHLLNRAQILDDANNLGVNLQLEPTVSLDIMNSLQREREPVVWITMLRQLEQLYDHLANSNHLRDLKASFAPFVETMSRSRTQDIAVIGKEVQDWTSALSDIDVKRQRRTNEDSPAEWCAAVRMDSGAWDAAWRRYEEAPSISARRDALAALGCARDASRLLYAAVADADAGAAERVRPEDVGAALAAPCGSETRRAVGGGGEDACTQAVAFIAQNTVKVQGLLGDSDEYLSLVRRLAQRIKIEEQYSMLHLAATAVHFGQRPLLRAEVWTDVLAAARARVDWAEGAGAPVLAWLKQHAHGRQ